MNLGVVGMPVSMSVAPTPETIHDRAIEEGRRRLSMPLLEEAATGFIAGVTVVFGIIALGVTDTLLAPDLGNGPARVAGAAAFGVGIVFLVVGRSELFSENFFDPVAAAIEDRGTKAWAQLLRLWASILILNLIGGCVLVALLAVDGSLPDGTAETLVHIAEQISAKSWQATLVRSVLAGTLITLLSYMLLACETDTARVLVAFLVGFVLALGPFDHVVVSALHLTFAIWDSGTVGYRDLWRNVSLAASGNVAGGLLLITLTHTAQTKGRR